MDQSGDWLYLADAATDYPDAELRFCFFNELAAETYGFREVAHAASESARDRADNSIDAPEAEAPVIESGQPSELGRSIAHARLYPVAGSRVSGLLTFVQAGDPANIRPQREPAGAVGLQWFGAMVAGEAEGLNPGDSYGLYLWAERGCSAESANFVGKPWLLVGNEQGSASEGLSATAIGFTFPPRSVSLHAGGFSAPQPIVACGDLEIDAEAVHPF